MFCCILQWKKHSLVSSSLNEVVMQVGGLKETCQELIPYLPHGQFKEAMTETLHGVYWLSKAFRSLDPITDMGQKVALSDFFDSDEPKRKKPSAASRTPVTQVTDMGGGATELGGGNLTPTSVFM